MRRTLTALTSAAFTLGMAFAAPALSAVVVTSGSSEGVHTDAFEGATVLASSGILSGFSAQDAFGAVTSNPPYEESQAGGHVIFDGSPLAFINFDLGVVKSLSAAYVYASSDGAGTPFRGFSGVELFSSQNGVDFTSLGSATYNPALGPVTIAFSFEAPVTARYFRFEGTDQNNGARLMEIDGIGAAVPEPATWALMIGGFGLAGATLRRRRTASARIG